MAYADIWRDLYLDLYLGKNPLVASQADLRRQPRSIVPLLQRPKSILTRTQIGQGSSAPTD